MIGSQLSKPIAKQPALPYEYVLNKKLFTLLQIALLLALPAFYQMVVSYAGQSIFTSTGYTRLRYAFNNEGRDMGRLGYLYSFAFLSAAIGVLYAAKNQLNKWQAVLSILIALIYAISVGALNWAPVDRRKSAGIPLKIGSPNMNLADITRFNSIEELVMDPTGQIPAQSSGRVKDKSPAKSSDKE